jgi:hypothetical protein
MRNCNILEIARVVCRLLFKLIDVLCPFFLSWLDGPVGSRHPPWQGFEITLRHATLGNSPLDETNSLQRPSLPDNRQQSQQGGIRNLDYSKQTAADPRHRLRGHWDRRCPLLPGNIFLHINSNLGISVKQQQHIPVLVIKVSSTLCYMMQYTAKYTERPLYQFQCFKRNLS